MVGGIVTRVIKLTDRIWIDCEETNYSDKCAIYVKRDAKSERVQPGDSIWWQGGRAMHTPYWNHVTGTRPSKQGVDFDIVLEKIGYSGVSAPAAAV